jgi:serine protease Do
LVFQIGETGARPLVGQLASNGVAVEAGFMPGDEFVSISGEKTPTWGSVAQRIATTVMAGEDLSIRVRGEEGFARDLVVNASIFGEFDENTDVLKTLGIEPAKPQIPAIVGEVIPNGPAEKAGMQQGDVILNFDGQEVADTRGLVRTVANTDVGKSVRVVVLRDGKTQTLKVTLGRREEAEAAVPAAQTAPEKADELELMGLSLKMLNDELRTELELDVRIEGMVVVDVDETSAAYEKGLRAGDVITEAGQQKLAATADLQARIDEAKEAGRKSLLLLVRRAGEPRFVALPLGD